jgi:hypothetical protein
MSKVFLAAIIIAPLMLLGGQAMAGGILGKLLFGSLDDTQAECQAQNPNNFSGTWRCIRAHVARGHTGDMQNGAALKYMATGDMLFAKVRNHQMDDATALYYLANALSIGDLEYSVTHPAPAPSPSFHCQSYAGGAVVNCQ